VRTTFNGEPLLRPAEADLCEPPLTVFGRNAVDRLFTPEEVRELLELAAALAA
jgi:hypothetical protein